MGNGESASLWERGLELERSGDRAGALAVYQQATDLGERPTNLRAVLRHAEQLELRGRNTEAESEFRAAGQSSERDVKAQAWRGIASYLLGRGEIEEGLAALQVIVETGDPVEAPRALRNIGTFREDVLGDLEGARAAYEASIALDHPSYSQGARVNLAQLLDRQGDHAGAAQLFLEVIDSGHPVEAPRAQVLLGMLFQEQGDEPGALACYETVMAAPGTEWGQRAAFQAGAIYLRRGQPDRAAAAFGIAESIPDPQQAQAAAFMHGDAAKECGDQQSALEAFARAVSADVPDNASTRGARCGAAKNVGVILMGRGEFIDAREFLAVAADAPEADEMARGLCLLAFCERQLGNRDVAIATFERALTGPDVPPEIWEMAQRSLMELGALR